MGSFMATDTKNLLNSDAISEGFSMVLSSIFNDKILLPILDLLAPSSLKSFHTLAGITSRMIIRHYNVNDVTKSPSVTLLLHMTSGRQSPP